VTYEFVLGELERGGAWPYAGKPCWILTSRDLPIPDGEGVDIRMVNGAVRDHFDKMMRSAGDNRQLNHALHIAAITQIRFAHSPGRTFFDRKVTEGKTNKEAVSALKRRIADAVYRQLLIDKEAQARRCRELLHSVTLLASSASTGVPCGRCAMPSSVGTHTARRWG